MENNKKPCQILDIDGVISGGKQFDLDITLPEDNRDVIYGVVKNCFKEPVADAAVKLVEIVYDCGKEERRPIGHTFTDCEGEFVFGPLCPGKQYAIQIWVNDTKKIKICAKCHHEGRCLKGEKHEKCDCFLESDKCKDKKDEKCDKKYDEKYDEKHNDKCWDKYEEKDEDKCCDKYDDKHEDKCCNKYDDKHENKCNKKCDEKHDDKKPGYYDRPCCCDKKNY